MESESIEAEQIQALNLKVMRHLKSMEANILTMLVDVNKRLNELNKKIEQQNKAT